MLVIYICILFGCDIEKEVNYIVFPLLSVCMCAWMYCNEHSYFGLDIIISRPRHVWCDCDRCFRHVQLDETCLKLVLVLPSFILSSLKLVLLKLETVF